MLFARRAVTMLPALVVLGLGLPVTASLVISQVVLSFGIPFAVLPLVRLTSNRNLMGSHANHAVTTAIGWAVAVLVSVLNVVLVYLTMTGSA